MTLSGILSMLLSVMLSPNLSGTHVGHAEALGHETLVDGLDVLLASNDAIEQSMLVLTAALARRLGVALANSFLEPIG